MEKIVFTNGCFDILHPGHVDLLTRARALGTRLVVGINGDASVRSIKGPERPILGADERTSMLLALRTVDEVRVFDEPTPERLIREVAPDVLVKGGDWPVEQIVGADFVLGRGGEVFSLPLVDGFSTTSIVERLRGGPAKAAAHEAAAGGVLERTVSEHIAAVSSLLGECAESVETIGAMIADTLSAGGKILICGNGGSAADAQHIAAEFVGRYETERRGLPAIALTVDTSALTAIANDYSFERVFARQVEALARPGDLLIGISTSGNSPNVIAAVMKAREIGCRVVGMTGSGGKRLAGLSDACLLVGSARTARIQETHITAAHIWCEMVR